MPPSIGALREGAEPMGTRKSNLMRGDRYGLLKAAELAAEMIGLYERARDGATAIRVESPDEAVWDDVHVVRSSHTDKWQIKRLKKPLGDEDFAEILKAAFAAGQGAPASYHLGVPRFVQIKKGKKVLCDLQELSELCEEARKPGLVPAEFVQAVQARSSYTSAISNLPAETSSDDLVAMLQRLAVHELGLEDALRDRAAAHLRDRFLNAKELVTQLHNWFVQHPDGTLLADVNVLYSEVIERYGKREPGSARWIHLSRSAGTPQWEARGTLPLGGLVSSTWGTQETIRVQLGTPPIHGEDASSTLCRLALHHSSRTIYEASEGFEWRAHSSQLCGGTLGEPSQPTELACAAAAGTPPHPAREKVTETRLGITLEDDMNQFVWSAYVAAVDRILREEEIEAALRTAMQAMWTSWNAALTDSASRRASFVSSMLATAEEWTRAGFDRRIRSGRRLIGELARTTLVALALAATFHAGGIDATVGEDGSIDTIRLGSVRAHAIALSAASHPSDRRPRRLSDAPWAMFSGEAGVAILGGIEASAHELFSVAREEAVPFYASPSASQNYHHAGGPFPFFTNSPPFRNALRKGIPGMQRHLLDILGRMHDQRVESLIDAVKGGLPAHG